jgi:antirestriction protein ArdC
MDGRVEPPPDVYARGPTQTGRTTEMRFEDLGRIDRLCRTWRVAAGDGGQVIGCYIPALDLVVLPASGAWGDSAQLQALQSHEWAHARGWRHQEDGRGTDWRISLAPRGERQVELATR